MDHFHNIDWFWNKNLNTPLKPIKVLNHTLVDPRTLLYSHRNHSYFDNQKNNITGLPPGSYMDFCHGFRNVNLNGSDFATLYTYNYYKSNIIDGMVEQNLFNTQTDYLRANYAYHNNDFQMWSHNDVLVDFNQQYCLATDQTARFRKSSSTLIENENKVQMSYGKINENKLPAYIVAPKKKWIRHYMLGESIFFV